VSQDTLHTLFGLDEKVAIVTGGTGVLGAATARGLAQAGARVGILGRRRHRAEEVAQSIEQAGGQALVLPADVLRKDQLEAARDAALERWGRIDILVNNAGVALLEPALEVSESNWDKTLDLNLKAAFFLSQLVAKEMIRTGGGKIVNIGSQAGMIALERHVAYMASKAAIIGITKVLAVEWAKHNVQVNAISPTVTLTELGKQAWAGEVGEEFKRKLPAGRFADPDEIAACALFLASNATDMITGSNLVIDGGYTIQ